MNSFRGPRLGPRESTSNPRAFSEEQQMGGKSVIGLLMAGCNKGASQSGMSFGRQRQILEYASNTEQTNVECVNARNREKEQ